jgi:hypothetical protein
MGLISGLRNTIIPAKGTGTNQTLRVDDYGNLVNLQALPAGFTAALEGSLFVARNAPTVGGTGVALGIATTFVDTTPALVLTNAEATGGKTYLPLYIRARITAAGSSSTSAEISAEVDNTNRYTSGGTSLTSKINNVNAASGAPASVATLVVGAITAAAAGARRRFVGAAVAKIAASPLWIVQDVITVVFGGAAQFVQQAQVIASDAAAPVANSHIPMAACAVPPGGSFVLNWANIANATTAPSVEFEMAWVER